MGQKVTFDAVNKIIHIDAVPVSGDVSIDVKIDLYSDGKEDWVADANLFKYRFPFRAVGGDILPGSKALGSTFFLDSAWKIRPYEGNHRLLVNGNLFSEDGTSPFTDTVGSWQITIESTVSSLVDSTVQQLAEIEYSVFQNVITLDSTNGVAGTEYPTGTPLQPVNNLPDAITIGAERGFDTITIVGNYVFQPSDVVDDFIFQGDSATRHIVSLTAAATITNCVFRNLTLLGNLDGGCSASFCIIAGINYIDGSLLDCLLSSGDIVLQGTQANFLRCASAVAGGGAGQAPYIDLNGGGTDVVIRDYQGGLGIKNCSSATEDFSADISSGRIIFDSTITAGTYTVRGIGSLEHTQTGTEVIVNQLLDPIRYDEVLTAIRAKTDEMTFTKVNELDVNVQSLNDATLLGNGTDLDKWRG